MLPPLSFLDATDEQKAKTLLANAKEILEMYHVKEREKMAEVLNHKPYSGFAETNIVNHLASIEELIREQDYTTAMKRSNELIKTALQGLRYLQTYAWLFLRTLVTAGYLGWIVFAFTTAVDVYALNGKIDVQRRTRTHYNFYLDPGRALQSAHFPGITDQILRIRLLSSLVLGRGFCAVEGAGRAQEKTVFTVFEK